MTETQWVVVDCPNCNAVGAVNVRIELSDAWYIDVVDTECGCKLTPAQSDAVLDSISIEDVWEPE